VLLCPCVFLVCSAAAAASASALLGPELLSHIRLPGWSQLLPAPTPAAAAAATSLAQQPGDSSSSSLWWHGNSSSRIHTNHQWLQQLQQDAATAATNIGHDLHIECDCCGSLLPLPAQQQQQSSASAPCCCAGCGVAVYCSSSCRAADARAHSRHCRLLQAVAQPGGGSRDWTALTAAAAAAAGSSLAMLRR
jgi:hypothetical protein